MRQRTLFFKINQIQYDGFSRRVQA